MHSDLPSSGVGEEGGKHRSRLISALFFFIGLQIDRRGGKKNLHAGCAINSGSDKYLLSLPT